ncbi:MAG: PadR family transcriptional regulator [Desulfomonile sp.]|nr:PadR family transcriptional regulator [Desulfomonile sp.]
MDIRSILLGFLMHDSMTGYDLKKAFSISFSFFSGLSYGSIYPALRKMEKQGLISKRLEIRSDGPNRKIYTITDAGKAAFLDALRVPLPRDQPKSPFLMRLFFFTHLSPEERQAIVVNYLSFVEETRRQMEIARPEIEARADRFQFLCYEFGLRFFSDLTRNLAQVVDSLDEEEKEERK